jgi:uncharacterized protein
VVVGAAHRSERRLVSNLRYSVLWSVLLMAAWCVATPAQEYTKPRVRTVTAFVRLEPASYPQQISDALVVLRAARHEFEQRGYEVQTLRIVTQPLGELVAGKSAPDALAFLKALNDLSIKESFLPNLGPAMLRDRDDPERMRLLARALATLSNVNGSAIIAADDGIHWKVIQETAALVRYLADNSPNGQGTFHFAATAMLKPYAPFFPGAYHTGEGKRLSIGFQGANVVQEVFAHTHGDYQASLSELTRQLTVHATVAEEIGERVAASHGWTFMGVDPTPAPMADVSIGAAIESYSGAKFGSSGTLTAAAIITAAVKAVPVKQAGFAGLMVPVMEDKVLAQRWAEGTYNTDSLLAYSAVCGTGLDTVPYPGEIGREQLARIFGDVATLAKKWNKPLAARLQPVPGKGAGELTQFNDPYLFNTRLHALP